MKNSFNGELILEYSSQTYNIPRPKDYNELLSKFIELFKISEEEKKNFKIRYLDEENEEIDIVQDEDYKDYLGQLEGDNTIKNILIGKIEEDNNTGSSLDLKRKRSRGSFDIFNKKFLCESTYDHSFIKNKEQNEPNINPKDNIEEINQNLETIKLNSEISMLKEQKEKQDIQLLEYKKKISEQEKNFKEQLDLQEKNYKEKQEIKKLEYENKITEQEKNFKEQLNLQEKNYNEKINKYDIDLKNANEEKQKSELKLAEFKKKLDDIEIKEKNYIEKMNNYKLEIKRIKEEKNDMALQLKNYEKQSLEKEKDYKSKLELEEKKFNSENMQFKSEINELKEEKEQMNLKLNGFKEEKEQMNSKLNELKEKVKNFDEQKIYTEKNNKLLEEKNYLLEQKEREKEKIKKEYIQKNKELSNNIKEKEDKIKEYISISEKYENQISLYKEKQNQNDLEIENYKKQLENLENLKKEKKKLEQKEKALIEQNKKDKNKIRELKEKQKEYENNINKKEDKIEINNFDFNNQEDNKILENILEQQSKDFTQEISKIKQDYINQKDNMQNQEIINNYLQKLIDFEKKRRKEFIEKINDRPKIVNFSLNETVHEGFRCQKCRQKPIIGIRYECSNCHNYNLCEKCEKEIDDNIEHRNHDFIKIRNAKKNAIRENEKEDNQKKEIIEKKEIIKKEENQKKEENKKKEEIENKKVIEIKKENTDKKKDYSFEILDYKEAKIYYGTKKFQINLTIKNNCEFQYPDGAKIKCLDGSLLKNKNEIKIKKLKPNEKQKIVLQYNLEKLMINEGIKYYTFLGVEINNQMIGNEFIVYINILDTKNMELVNQFRNFCSFYNLNKDDDYIVNALKNNGCNFEYTLNYIFNIEEKLKKKNN